MSNVEDDSETPLTKPEGWKISCAAAIALSVSQLDERMIFYLASLPKSTYNHLVTVFNLHSQGKLKDQSVPRSEKGISSILNLKGSAFKCFRGLNMETVGKNFSELAEKKVSLKEALVQCSDTKALKKIQEAFVRGTKSGNWENAVKNYPQHCTPEMLEPFKSQDLSGELPNEFKFFCSEVMNTTSSDVSTKEVDDGVFHVCSVGLDAIVCKAELVNMEPSNLYSWLEGLNINILGFTLVVLDYAYETTAPEEIPNLVKESILAIRAINFHKGLHNFSIVVFCNLDSSFMAVYGAVLNGCDVDELAVCGSDYKTPNDQKSSNTLLPSTIGVLIGRIGDPVVRASGRANFFTHEMEVLVVDPGTNKPVYAAQKPVSLFTEVLELYSSPGDWILNGPDSAGSCAVAACGNKRNSITINSNAMTYIHTKIRLVKSLKIECDAQTGVDDSIDKSNEETSEEQ